MLELEESGRSGKNREKIMVWLSFCVENMRIASFESSEESWGIGGESEEIGGGQEEVEIGIESNKN